MLTTPVMNYFQILKRYFSGTFNIHRSALKTYTPLKIMMLLFLPLWTVRHNSSVWTSCPLTNPPGPASHVLLGKGTKKNKSDNINFLPETLKFLTSSTGNPNHDDAW